MLGLGAAVCTVVVGYLRTRSVPLEGAFTLFLLFFMFSIIREIAGYFPFLMNANVTDNENNERAQMKPYVVGIGALILLISVGVMYKSFHFPSTKMYAFYRNHKNLMFILENVLVTLSCLAPEIYISMQHTAFFNSTSKLSTNSSSSSVLNKWNVLNFIVYAICHMTLQFAGFYDLFYSVTNSYTRFGWTI